MPRNSQLMRCNDSRPCFAKQETLKKDIHGDPLIVCMALEHHNYPDGKCPFCKPKRDK